MPAPPLSAVDATDLLLLAAVRRRAAALVLDPIGDEHVVVLESEGLPPVAASLPRTLGDAVIARLALIAGLDVAAPEEQLGRLRLRLRRASAGAELLLVVRTVSGAQAAEVRALAATHGPSGELAPGDRVGSYRLIAELGRGGTGVVYAAEHVVLRRRVALKVLLPELATRPDVAARFIREARAAARTRHPGIVDVTDFGTLPDGRAFLAMELVDGRTLSSILGDGPLPPRRAARIGRRIADALAAAHAAGVVHRDLKPANVFVLPGDRVKIGDFGAAKCLGAGAEPGLTQEGFVLGTPHYMSPEHGRGQPTDHRTDVYALGCVLFEMLAGDVPYDAPTGMDVLLRHIHDPIPPLGAPERAVPELLAAVVRRALAKSAGDRHQSARELAADLGTAEALLPADAETEVDVEVDVT